MRSSRLLSAVLIVCAIVLAVTAACTPAAPATSAPSGDAEPGGTSAPPASASEPTTIQWLIWSDDITQEKNLLAEIDLFNAAHPEIKVEIIGAPWAEFTAKLQTMVAAGTPPDVVSIQNEAEYVSKGFMLQLDDLFKRDLDVSNYVPGAHEPAYDGHYYGLRHDTSFWILFYNKDMFDAAGVAYPPAEGWTIEEFEEAACALSNPDENRWGMYNWNWIHGSVLEQRGIRWLDMVDGVPQFSTDPKAVEVFQEIGDFINKSNCQINKDQSDSLSAGDPFISGYTAMKLDGNWSFGYITENAKFQWDIAPAPGVKQFVGGMKIGVAKTSKKQEAAWTFVKWLTYEPEATRYRAKAGMGQPAIADQEAWNTYYESAPASLKAIVEQLSKPENVFATLDPPGRSEADGILNPAIDEVWFATGAAADVLPQAIKDANEVLAREWKKANP
jgi:multiple sugar transport system substrate-binding protein